jgi:tetratricopeptide (TPR) repeat protein
MTQKCIAKEIHFLKKGSKDDQIHPPQTYFSDLIHTPGVQYKAFEDRLNQIPPKNGLICAIVQIDVDAGETVKKKARDSFEACFNSILDKASSQNRGLWEALDETAFALAFWDYDREKDGLRLLTLLRDKISKQLETRILMGTASFPCHDFSWDATLPNALKAIDHAAFFGPGHMIHFDAVSLNISGDRRFQLEQYEQALADFQAGLAISPKDINLINSLGVTHGIMGNLDKALEFFESASAINPKEVMVVYNIGLIHRINEKNEKAVFYLKKAHGISPEVFEIELLLGHLLYKQAQPDQALVHIEAACRLKPDAGTPFRIKGQILLDREDAVGAGAAFNSAVKFSPADAAALSGYAKAMALQEKNLTIALSFAQKSLGLDPDNPLYKERLEEIRELTAQAQDAGRGNAIKSA